ncbi:MAG: hypothetical protein ABJG68_14880 [Crocinitomicaceae bacterium]
MNKQPINSAITQDEVLSLFQKSFEKQDEENRNLVELFHEQIGAELLALKMKINQAEISDQLKSYVEENLNGIVQKIKAYSNELFPMSLDQLGFEQAFNSRIRSYQLNNQVNIQVKKLFREKITLQPKIATAMFFIIDEIIKNCLAHAKCDTIEINLLSKTPFKMEIIDNGTGFECSMSNLRLEHSGLNKIICRAKAIDAKVKFEKLPLAGSKVNICVHE